MRIKAILFSILFSFILVGCKTTSTVTEDPAEAYKNYSDKQLFDLGKRALDKKKYKGAIKYYEALNSLYPFGPYSEATQRNIIYAYFQTGDYTSAGAAAEYFIRLYPRSTYIDYAYYMKGLSVLEEHRTFMQRVFPIDLSERDLTSARQAFFDFRDLLQLYPNSKYAPDARQHMIQLRNLFANYELEVAQYYFKRKAYVAAANRATYIIQHYQGTPQVEQALVILVKSNRALGLKNAAEEALKVLRTNFPKNKL